jgi:hypothetical protein
VVRAIFNSCNQEITFKEGAIEKVVTRTQNYALAFGMFKNEFMIREFMINNIEQEANDACDSV